MQKFVILSILGGLFFLLPTATRGQDSGESVRLRRENELLKKEIELLKKEVELLKKEAKGNPAGAEDPKNEKPRTKAVEFGSVEYELVKCVRDPKSRTRVIFSFSVQNEFGKGDVQTVHGCKELTLTTEDGTVLDGKVVHVSNNMVMLTKGEKSRFQVIYDGVDRDITSFDEVSLTMGAVLGIPRSPLHFYRIKIQPK
jgi:hypothetical protein